MARAIHSVADWSEDEIDSLLRRAGELAHGVAPRRLADPLVGMCFFQTSLRTRVGFESAAHRLGIDVVEVVERRSSAESMPESIEDTIRVGSGYCDALVVRAPRPSRELHAASRSDIAWLNAGDTVDHPTQALIDLFAMERLAGPVGELHVAVVGDLRMRSARSLLRLLEQRPPKRLSTVSAPEFTEGSSGRGGTHLTEVSGLPERQPDVVYLAGIPHQATTEEVRTRLRLDRETLEALSPSAIVLSPLPLIDEVASNARNDPRVRWFEQSDLGLHVRTAVLEQLLERSGRH